MATAPQSDDDNFQNNFIPSRLSFFLFLLPNDHHWSHTRHAPHICLQSATGHHGLEVSITLPRQWRQLFSRFLRLVKHSATFPGALVHRPTASNIVAAATRQCCLQSIDVVRYDDFAGLGLCSFIVMEFLLIYDLWKFIHMYDSEVDFADDEHMKLCSTRGTAILYIPECWL